MKNARPLLSALALTLMTVSGPAIATESVLPRAVVELYTSQGCNSCPPADQVLHDMADQHDDLLLLSYHVDYWNYLGWEDPFSDARYSARQRDYANRMRERYVYTPQVIINGDHVVRATAKQQIEATSTAVPPLLNQANIHLGMLDPSQPATGTITLRGVGKPAPGQIAQIWLIGFDREHQRDVLSGENAGKRLVNANVVREMVSLGQWNGTSQQKIPFAMAASYDGGIAVLIQNGRGGPISGAAMIRFGD
ncbi:thioredoxin family protein [Thalassospira sp. HF15]|uniref:DUF1223 domain-containing protein n=1 Tax=Thalassospira sp. HF15 TaxID=2722755 RepID=UPI0020CA3CEE|nr:DUF1223 domain-containing protein [Thalassospira sp. HF15]